MNATLVLGISLALFLGYRLLRQLMERSSSLAAYQKEINDLIKNEKYQVKGRFE